ncbi:MAG: Transposase IS4 family protein [Candidatus Gottesmanbacteria bacterium GW2011_GWC2_39_8]|uniref:Transposase IS4 family protein n=1 Tax=Candidatus Gottesmanbacteria bacterium GW2011_GWC2_39_8 TaxID=1618450 RepID=A0A0G0SF09_9BACT|nr:MAG: Transposase IS4 family protein [Candidatus Gottesmanbacteria bacterium GW2011_GWC2_39_8]
MFHIRTTKTASGATAVQVVKYLLRKRIVVKHLGSAHTDEDLGSLKKIAARWIEKATRQQTLFPPEEKKTSLPLVSTDKLRNIGFHYTFAYEVLTKLLALFALTDKDHRLLLDLVLIRIIKPASKLASLILLSELFGIRHERTEFYRSIPSVVALKETIEKSVIALASKHFAFDFQIVFYDVTTLYFESFTEDEDKVDADGNIIEKGLKKDGFSKDFKFNQPQVVIGLIVTKEGFPVSYEVFEGNTFEGATFIPVISGFKKKYAISSLTVVADAAMISFDNVEKLKEQHLSYIVGGRMASLKLSEMEIVAKALTGQTRDEKELAKKDGISTRIETERGLLICDFSFKRYLKEKREMEKQILKARLLLERRTGIKRTKFLKNKDKKKTEQVLNSTLIERTKRLLGIKGYYTNLREKTDKTIIDHYRNLWHVEQAFRIAKSDLAARPVYHFKRQAIEAHILICFMALSVCKYMELKTKKSTQAIIKLLMQVTDARILHTLTNEEIILRSEISTETEEILKKLSLSH